MNAIAESASRKGTLFVGTDGGAYASFDSGKHWGTIHPDLPRVPVHDIAIQERENDVIIGTHGRSIWVLDLNVMWEQWTPEETWREARSKTAEIGSIEPVTWNESWGEKGWAWSDPSEPNATIKFFSPKAFEADWHIDQDTINWAQSEEALAVHRGWQLLELPLRKTLEDPEEAYLSPGVYTVSLRSTDGAFQATGELRIEEEEEEEE